MDDFLAVKLSFGYAEGFLLMETELNETVISTTYDIMFKEVNRYTYLKVTMIRSIGVLLESSRCRPILRKLRLDITALFTQPLSFLA